MCEECIDRFSRLLLSVCLCPADDLLLPPVSGSLRSACSEHLDDSVSLESLVVEGFEAREPVGVGRRQERPKRHLLLHGSPVSRLQVLRLRRVDELGSREYEVRER